MPARPALGFSATGQSIQAHSSVLECRVLDPEDRCRRGGQQGVPRGTVTRGLAHVPFGWRPTTLRLRVRRYRCSDCRAVWRQDTTAARSRPEIEAVPPRRAVGAESCGY